MKRLFFVSFMLLFILALSSCEEPVVEIKVSSITLNSESLSMTEGETFKLNATVSPDNATDKTVIWSTSDAGIANVEEGVVTAVREGSATITAASKDGGAKVTCPVTVAPKVIDVTGITLSRQEAIMNPGETLTLTATVKPDDATDKTVTWTSNNISVASVKDGVVTAVSIGAASITATAGGKSATCTITVKEAYIEVTSVTLNQTSVSILEGESVTLKATVKPADATDKTVTWTSSNPDVLTVYGGKVTGISAGTATVTASAGGKSATCEVEVIARIPVESVTLDLKDITLFLGDTETLTATVLPENATDKTVRWESSDSNIASVRGGTVTARAVGTATITAIAGTKSATCTVTVKPIEVESITLNTYHLALNPNESETLTATVLPANATDKTVTWTSSNPNIATVSNGTVTALAKGSAFITARAGNKEAVCEVTVNDNYLTVSNLTNYQGQVTIKASGVTSPTITLLYSTDNGHTWEALNSIKKTQTIPLPAGGKVMLSGNNQTYCSNTSTRGWWSISADVSHNVSGNLMTISGDENELSGKYEFYKLFCGDTKLKSARYLQLPADKLSERCYQSMFEGCTALEKAPDLTATTLATACYESMFEGCTALTDAPMLAATELKSYCYQSMFKGCTALKTAPRLPASALAKYCYNSMFKGCTALVDAPELPAIVMADLCYANMFEGCTALVNAPALPGRVLAPACYTAMFKSCKSLEQAPELPATTMKRMCYYAMFAECTSLATAPELPSTSLAEQCYTTMFLNCFALEKAPVLPAEKLATSCYAQMFAYCGSLAEITCLAKDISATECTLDWLKNVALSGTFIKNPAMESWTAGSSGIPENWTVKNYGEEPEE